MARPRRFNPDSTMKHMKTPTPAKTAQKKSKRTKSAPATRKKVQPPEWEDDEFDRALAKALDAGAFDEMIAEAMQDEREGKVWPL